MKYETPELTALTPAINAIQSPKDGSDVPDGPQPKEAIVAYQDWE